MIALQFIRNISWIPDLSKHGCSSPNVSLISTCINGGKRVIFFTIPKISRDIKTCCILNQVKDVDAENIPLPVELTWLG
jgi:hypothetical protein